MNDPIKPTTLIQSIMKKSGFFGAGVFFLLSILPSALYAAGGEGAEVVGTSMEDILVVALGSLFVLLLLYIVAQMRLTRLTLREIQNQVRIKQGLEPLPAPLTLEQLYHKHFTGLKPMDDEVNQPLAAGHEYDGITELDNGMPPWLQYFFGVTIAFAVVYFAWYTVLGIGPDQFEEYRREMAYGDSIKQEYRMRMANTMDENTVTLATEVAELENGKALYMENCSVCHGDKGEGGVGPNLTDSYWIHGGGIKNVFRVIMYGVPDKGMIPWEDRFSPGEIRNIASFVLGLEGTNPPNPKAPEGQVWTPTEEDDAAEEGIEGKDAETEVAEGASEEVAMHN